MTIKIADDSFNEKWDEIVNNSPHGTIFHLWKWLKIVEKYSNSKLYQILVYKDSNLLGLYPIFLKKYGIFSVALSPPPNVFLLYLGPIILDYEIMKQNKKESTLFFIQQEVDDYLFSILKCKFVRIRTAPLLFDSRPFHWCGYRIEPAYTYRLDLRPGVEPTWDGLDRKLRVDINKARKVGVNIEEGNLDDLEFIFHSVGKRMSAQGIRSKASLIYLKELFQAFHPQHMTVTIAKYKNERVGGMISLSYKDTVFLWIGIPKSHLSGVSPNDLIQWQVIENSCINGFTNYELMDAGDNRRLTHFKSKYNPSLTIWYSITKARSPIYQVISDIRHRV